MSTSRSVRWTRVGRPGLEDLRLHIDDHGIIADSVILGATDEGAPFRCLYTLRLDSRWQVTALDVRDETGHLALRRDERGFHDERGEIVASLAGCIDVDLSPTPFTNSLPIRRLHLARGESREIDVAHVAVPGLTVKRARQRYTRLESGHERADVYRYESLASGYTAQLTVDADGLVLDYPQLFHRVA